MSGSADQRSRHQRDQDGDRFLPELDLDRLGALDLLDLIVPFETYLLHGSPPLVRRRFVRRRMFSGFVAWWLWRTIYLAKLPRLEKKLRVMLDWTLDLAFSKDLVQFLSTHRGVGTDAGPERSLPVEPHAVVPARVERPAVAAVLERG